jgi:hypothetical protein
VRGQPAVIGHGGDVEIEAALDLVAMIGRDLLREVDHLVDMVGRDRPARGIADVEIAQVGLERAV